MALLNNQKQFIAIKNIIFNLLLTNITPIKVIKYFKRKDHQNIINGKDSQLIYLTLTYSLLSMN